MRYLSVCSGIEAATCAWHPLGWTPVAFSEIEPFPCAVLAHHYPTVPNWGDMTKFQEWPDATVDLLVGGTPCQSFSVAGLRKGLADPRGNLALTYLAIAARYRPAWVVWENVPGVLSDAGNAFGNFLAGLSELGYGWAYRVLDAQYVRVESHPRAVPQRRRRVFVVGCLGDWRRAASVLFERESLCGHPAPSRETGERIAPCVEARARGGGGGWGTDFLSVGGMTEVAHSLKADGFDASEDGTGRGTPLVPAVCGSITAGMGSNKMGAPEVDANLYIPAVCGTLSDGAHMGGGSTARTPTQAESSRCLNAGGMGRQDWETETFVLERTGGGFDAPLAFSCKDHGADASEIAPTLRSMGHDGSHANAGGQVAIAYDDRNQASSASVHHTLRSDGIGSRNADAIAFHNRQDPDVSGDVTHPIGRQDNGLGLGMKVRRLTPTECERLMGFPDGYTDVPYRGKPAADGPRYKALGNSMAVNVMRWIGDRLAA